MIYGTDGPAVIAKLCCCWVELDPALISTYAMVVICLLVPEVSYKRSIHERDKKGRVRLMRSIAVRFSGRKLAAPLTALRSAVAGCVAAGGGSG